MTGSLRSSFRQPDTQVVAAQALAASSGGSANGSLASAPGSIEGSMLGRAASAGTQHSSGGSLVMPYM